jgi:hypothetical protein
MLNKNLSNILKKININNKKNKTNFQNFYSISKISKNFSSSFKLDINFSHAANNLQINSMKIRRKYEIKDKYNLDPIEKFISENLSKKKEEKKYSFFNYFLLKLNIKLLFYFIFYR